MKSNKFFYLVLILFLVGFVSAVQEVVLNEPQNGTFYSDTNLVNLSANFSDSTGIKNASIFIYNRDGTFVNSSNVSYAGNAIYLNGSNYIQTANINLSSSTPITYAMWIKPNFSSFQQPFIHWGSTSSPRAYWRLESAARMYYDLSLSSPKMYWNGNLFCSSTDCNGNVPAYSNGEWYFIALTGTYTGSAITNKPILIGSGNPTHAGRYFSGALDEVLIFNRSLNSTEILELYNSGTGLYANTSIAPFNSGLVAGYHLDEGSGTTAIDLTNRYNGTLTNGPTYITGIVPDLINVTYSLNLTSSFNLLDGIYNWFARIFNLTLISNTTDNRTFSINTIAPTISLENNSYVNNPNISSNFYDGYGLDNATITLINESGELNTTSIEFGLSTTLYLWSNLYNILDGAYTLLFNLYDTNGLNNQTNITIIYDSVNPNLTLISPGDMNFTTNSEINFTANLSDTVGLKNFSLNLLNNEGEEYRGRALSFDGSNDRIIKTSPASLENNDYTYNAWIKLSSLNTHKMVLGIGDSATGDQFMGIIDTNKPYLGSYYSGGSQAVTGSTTLTTGIWYMLTATRNSSDNVTIYLNGLREASSPVGNPGAIYGTIELNIGSRADAYQPFSGSIDEVSIFNRALNETEILELYNSGAGLYANTSIAPFNSGLVAGYHFDEDTGTNAIDITGNNDGTLTNGPIYTNGKVISSTFFQNFSIGTLENLFSSLLSLVDGIYTWSMTVYDLAGNSNTSETRTLVVDSSSSNLSVSFENNTFIGLDQMNDSITLTDSTAGLKNATLNIYNGSGLVNSSFFNWDIGEPGINNYALTLNENKYITLSNRSPFNFGSSNFTISTWTYLTATDIGYQMLIDGRTTNDASGWVFYIESNSQFSFITSSSGSGWENLVLHANCGVPPANQWTYLTVTRSGNTFSCYQNAILRNSGSYSGSIQSINVPITIGANHVTSQSGGLWNNNDKIIDEVLIFNRSLNSTEILELYNSGTGLYANTSIAPFNSGLIAGYHLDEGTGTTAIDITGRNNGTLTNGPTYVAGKVKYSERNTIGTIAEAIISFPIGLVSGAYTWFIGLFDWAGNEFVSENYTFELDSSPPNIEVLSPTNYIATTQDQILDFSANFTENNYLWNGSLEIYSTSGLYRKINFNNDTAPPGLAVTTADNYYGYNDDIISISSPIYLSSYWTISTWFYAPLKYTGNWNTLTRGSSYNHQVIVDPSGYLGTYDNYYGSGFNPCYDGGWNQYYLYGLSSDTWYLLSAVGHDGQTDFYINGDLVCTSYYQAQDDISYIGNYQGGGQPFGKIDEFTVWSTALSPTEISQLYNSGAGVSSYTSIASFNNGYLTAGYHFDVRSSTITDFTGNGYTATLTLPYGQDSCSNYYYDADSCNAQSAIGCSWYDSGGGDCYDYSWNWYWASSEGECSAITGGGYYWYPSSYCSGYFYNQDMINSAFSEGKVPGEQNADHIDLIPGYYSDPVNFFKTISLNGSNRFNWFFEARDLAGNVARSDNGTIIIDRESPTMGATYTTPNSTDERDPDMNITIYANVTDPYSGVNWTNLKYFAGNYVSPTTIEDSSTNDYTGTISGATFTNGKLIGAMSFDGSDDCIDSMSGYKGPQSVPFSVSLWAKVPYGSSGYPMMVSFGQTNSVNVGGVMIHDSWPGRVLAYTGDGNYYILSTNRIDDNAWHLITFTVDADNLGSLYIDGAFDNSVSLSPAFTTSGPDFSIGCSTWNGYLANLYAGQIDEVSIFSKSLTSGEVADIYNNGLGTELIGNEDGLVALYHMNDESESAGFTIIEMDNSTGLYAANVTLESTDSNYSYFIESQDNLGNYQISSRHTFAANWEYTWNASLSFATATGKYSTNKYIGNLTINNTGDWPLEFYSTRVSSGNLEMGKLLYDGLQGVSRFALGSNHSFKDSKSISLNLTFEDFEDTKDINITIRPSNASASPQNLTKTFRMVSYAGGPYFSSSVDTYNTSIRQSTNLSLGAYISNIGDALAYNLTLNWTLPTGMVNLSGNILSPIYANLTYRDSDPNNYTIRSDLILDVPSTVTAGTYTYYFTASGLNSSGVESELTTFSDSKTILVLCNQIDGLCGSGCTYVSGNQFYDRDCIESSSSSSGSGGGGGGGGAGSFAKSSANFELVRGDNVEFELTLENKMSSPKKDISITVKGNNSEYVIPSPSTLSYLGANSKENVKFKINAPSYFSSGKYLLEITFAGKIVGNTTTDFTEVKYVTLTILEMPREEADSYLNISLEILSKMNSSGFITEEVQSILDSMNSNYENLNFNLMKEESAKIEEIYNSATEYLKLRDELNKSMTESEKNGISTAETRKLFLLSEILFNRGDYIAAYEKLKEAKTSFLLETKGEFKLFYAIKNNPLESLAILISLSAIGVGSSYFVRMRLLKRKMKMLGEEEGLLLQLMRVVQRNCFEDNKMSMEEYGEAMYQYENRLSNVIQEKVMTETQLANLMRIGGKKKALNQERDRLTLLVKQTQEDYMNRGKLDTRIYENMLKTYATRLSKIEEQLVFIEAQEQIKQVSSFWERLFGGNI